VNPDDGQFEVRTNCLQQNPNLPVFPRQIPTAAANGLNAPQNPRALIAIRVRPSFAFHK